MSATVLNTRIKLRKDTETNFNTVASTLVPLDGEVCIVDTGANGIRLKVGDGSSTFGALKYIDRDSDFKSQVTLGYYDNGEFYTDAAKTEATKVTKLTDHIYLDMTTKTVYFYDNTALQSAGVPTATATTAGITKLYTEQGSNTDGAVTQKFVTDSFNAIVLSIDPDDEECLILSKAF